MTVEISLVERSTTQIGIDEFRRLDSIPEFWELLEAGVITAERRGRNGVSLRAGAYVGTANVGGCRIAVREKVAGSLAALVSSASGTAALAVRTPTFVSGDNAILAAIAESFITEVEAYLRRGRRRAYYPRAAVGASPRGKILVGSTMRVWAAGRRDRCAFTLYELSPEKFLNSLLGAAVTVVGCMVNEWPQFESLRRRVRTAALLFEDTDWHRVMNLPAPVFDLEYSHASPQLGSCGGLAGLARLFVRHFGVGDGRSEDAVPWSWFVKLELLFEEAVRQAMIRAAARRGLRATDWRPALRYVISGGRRWRAEPDVVIWDGATPLAIADAKYKDMQSAPDHGDVYQLLCHASAWNVEAAAIVYASTGTSFREIGKSSSGVGVRIAAMDVLRLDDACDSLVGLCAAATAQTG
ncbi:MAG: hypothetical protein U0572_13115 [Phycisphaerales bacterium]